MSTEFLFATSVEPDVNHNSQDWSTTATNVENQSWMQLFVQRNEMKKKKPNEKKEKRN
jgi:hypothetical protein